MKGDCVTGLLDRVQQEISERLDELRPLVEEAERLEVAAAALQEAPGTTPIARTPPAARSAAGRRPAVEIPVKASPLRRPRRAKVRRKVGSPSRKRPVLSANQRAIIAALAHAPHTVQELVTVTAMGDQTVRNNVKDLVGLEKVVKTERGGKAAYALPASAQETVAAA
jgi:hypothetical protein